MARARSLSTAVSAVLLTSVLFLTACGGSDDDATTTEPADTTAVVTTPVADTTPAETTPADTTPAETMPAETMPAETMPPATDAPETTAAALGSVIDVATAAGTFTIFLGAIETAGLTEQIATGKYTFLAPLDETITAALDQAAIDNLLADPVAALAMVNVHVLPGAEDAHTIGVFNSVVTLGGGSLDVAEDGDVVVVQGARIVTADIPADNGFVHVIDSIITPPA
jgi:uncharacterized surface protein with fasciclin (FAS1) repeats